MVRSFGGTTKSRHRGQQQASFKDALTVIVTEKRHRHCTGYIMRAFRNSLIVKINYISQTIIVWNTAVIVRHVC